VVVVVVVEGGEIFRTLQNGPGGHPVPCTMVLSPFPGSKSAGAWSSPPTPSSSEVKETADG